MGCLCWTGLFQLLLQLAPGTLPRTGGHGLHVSTLHMDIGHKYRIKSVLGFVILFINRDNVLEH